MSNPKEVGRTERIAETVKILSETGIIPNYVAFDITEDMLAEYIRVYGTLGSKGNGKFHYGFARKLAGLELLRLKFHRGAKAKDCKEGQVYLIGNPSWPEYIKIGMSIDSDARLDSYQTYDPFRAYYIKNYEFVLDRRLAERKLLDDFGFHLSEGEWVKYADSSEIIKAIRTF